MSDELFEELTDNKDPIELARKLSNTVQETYFDVGCLLWHIKDRDLYKTVDNKRYYSNDHTKWKEFLTENFSVGERTARYWMDIYEYYSKMGVTKDQLRMIGWSKAKELVDITENVNILKEGMDIAENGTIKDVKAWKALVEKQTEVLGEDTRETLTSQKFTFKYFEANAETFKSILEQAAKETNGDENEAMFKIAVEWLQSHIPENGSSPLIYDVEDEPESTEVPA
jgi:hypothetical protein